MNCEQDPQPHHHDGDAQHDGSGARPLLARAVQERHQQEGDEPEELEVVPWPLADLRSLTAREDCTEGRTIAALYIARDYLQSESHRE